MKETGISIFYRTCEGENTASRPNWYSKELCLRSMLLSYELLRWETTSSFTLLFDGFLNFYDEWSKTLRKFIEPKGDIIESRRQGNVNSVMHAIYRATEQPEENIVIFAEDDYLWLAPALVSLYQALTQLPVHYATPYDHPVRYQPEYPGGADCPHRCNTIYITGERHWRTQESTCMTFASTSRILNEDIRYFEKYKDNGRGRPEDRELFREMQGLGEYSCGDSATRTRILVGPMPSLATHAQLPWLAPLINWEESARRVLEEELK